MSRTIKDSNLKSRNEKTFLLFAYKVLGYPKELGKVMYIFPACYGIRHYFLKTNKYSCAINKKLYFTLLVFQ